MNWLLKETLKAILWMVTGAVLLIAGWFAFAQLILVPRLESAGIDSAEHPVGPNSRISPLPNRIVPDDMRYRHSTMSYMYVPDSEPALSEEHSKWLGGWIPDDRRLAVEHAIAGHRIAAGSGAVLNYQRYSDNVSLPDTTDRAVFEKLTIFLPENLANDYGALSLPENGKVIAFWSRGSPNIDSGVMCSGYATSGKIEYRRVSGEVEHRPVSGDIEAKVILDISPTGTVQPDGKPCEPFTFSEAVKFWTANVDNLGQWNGGGWGNISRLECAPSR